MVAKLQMCKSIHRQIEATTKVHRKGSEKAKKWGEKKKKKTRKNRGTGQDTRTPLHFSMCLRVKNS
jgi:hypothetical protein